MNDNTGAFAGTEENLLRQFPLALQWDKQMQVMATVIAAGMAQRWPEAELGILYPAIDQLPERVLDILAYDLKVDWYDYGYTVEEKRRTLKDAWKIHRIKGTKAAVETAISAIYPDTKVLEWFEYGGRPYTFKLYIDLTGTEWTGDRPKKVLERVNYYKSLRSHLEEIEYTRETDPAALRVGGAMASIISMPVPELADIFRFADTVRTGGTMAAVQSLPVPERADIFRFEDTVRTGGTMAAVLTIHIPENTTSTTSSRTGRVGVRGAVSVTIPLPEMP